MTAAPELPGYELVDLLGRGGFATVYRARQLAVDREVAVKIDNRALASEADRRRFVREVKAAGRLSGHPHVVNLFDAGTLPDGRPYLVMERCQRSLHDVVEDDGPLPSVQVRDLGAQLADALDAAHRAGVLHRDIKPANIMVTMYGMVVLTDFGLASILGADGRQSTTIESLTPAFAAPEAFRAEDPTPAGDVYSLAATLYTLLSGLPPRAGEQQHNLAAILARQNDPVPDIPGVSPALVDVLRRALEPDPAVRTASAAQLRDELARLPITGAPAAPSVAPAVSGPEMEPSMAAMPLAPPMAGAGFPSPGSVPPAAVQPPPLPGQPRRQRRESGDRRLGIVLAAVGLCVVSLVGGFLVAANTIFARPEGPEPTGQVPQASVPAPIGPQPSVVPTPSGSVSGSASASASAGASPGSSDAASAVPEPSGTQPAMATAPAVSA